MKKKVSKILINVLLVGALVMPILGNVYTSQPGGGMHTLSTAWPLPIN